MQNNLKSNKVTLIATLTLFFLPTVVATLLYLSGWRPAGLANHGELINPPRTIEEKSFTALDGKTIKFSELQGKWNMVYFDTAACPESCINQLFFMRQVHQSQGKELDRIQRVFVLTDDNSIAGLKDKLADYPNMLVLKAEKPVLASMLKEFSIDENSGLSARSIFFVDPQGYLMMRYQPGIDPAGMRKDLERLLKYSGDAK